jgi:hypothetical protein
MQVPFLLVNIHGLHAKTGEPDLLDSSISLGHSSFSNYFVAHMKGTIGEHGSTLTPLSKE